MTTDRARSLRRCRAALGVIPAEAGIHVGYVMRGDRETDTGLRRCGTVGGEGFGG